MGDQHPIVAFQGQRGSYSEQACREKLPGYDFLPCKTFEDLFDAVADGEALVGMAPVENSVAGMISDSYDLLAAHNLHVIGEHYLWVRHALLGVAGATLEMIQEVRSHPQALAQCRRAILKYGWNRQPFFDTAGAAEDLALNGNPHVAAIASEICAELYELKVLAREIQDSDLNTTRFLLVAREAVLPAMTTPCKTSLLFEVRDIPAALYKCLGGFATNGVNLTRLESRPALGKPWAYQFHLDFQGHPELDGCRLALEELTFFTTRLKVLGCYPEGMKPQGQKVSP